MFEVSKGSISRLWWLCIADLRSHIFSSSSSASWPLERRLSFHHKNTFRAKHTNLPDSSSSSNSSTPTATLRKLRVDLCLCESFARLRKTLRYYSILVEFSLSCVVVPATTPKAKRSRQEAVKKRRMLQMRKGQVEYQAAKSQFSRRSSFHLKDCCRRPRS